MSEKEETSDVIDRAVKDLRQRYPRLSFDRRGPYLTVRAQQATGFNVELVDAGCEVVVVLGGWVAYGLDEAEALAYFHAGLSGSARVLEISRGGQPYRWKVERLIDGTWVQDHSYYSCPIGSLPVLSFHRKHQRLLWNDPKLLHTQDLNPDPHD